MSVLLLVPTVFRSPTAWRANWETALSTVASTSPTVLCIGDSITEGNGATAKANRWTDRLNTYLQGKYNTGGVGGAGWISAHYAIGEWSAHTGQSGTVTPITTVGSPGYRALSMATSSSRTYTLTGTSVDIYWQRATGNGSFTWAVDGGSATTVSTSGTTSVLTKTTVTLGGTVGASHTLVITATTGPVVFEGLFVYNGDETHGPRVWEASHTGWDTNDFMNHADYANFAAFIGAIAPDLVLIQLGFNDYIHNSVTPSSYQTNLQTLLTTIVGLAKQPSIVLIDSYDFGDVVAGQTATQDDYRTVLLNLSGADPNKRTYLNFGDTMPPTDYSGSGYYRLDGIHPNDDGYNEINRQISIATTPWAPPDPITATATVVVDAYEIGEATTTATVLATDTFTGTNGAAWSSQWTTSNINSATTTIQSNVGRMNTVSTTVAYLGGPRATLTGMTATADMDAVFSYTYGENTEQYTWFTVRSDGQVAADTFTPNNGYSISIQRGGTPFWAPYRYDNGVGTLLSGTVNTTWTAGTKYWVRLRVVGAVFSITLWTDGNTEPATPDYTYTDPSPNLTAGYLMLNNANGAAGSARILDIDDLTVTNGVTGTTAETPLTGPSTLANWRAAVEYRQYAPATWLAIGDSITEGYGSSGRTNRWIDQATSQIRTSYPVTGVTGGVGFLPAWYGAAGYLGAPYTTRALGAGSLTDETGVGFGGRTTAIGPGATITYTITGDAMDVWWVAGGGTLTFTLDGSAPFTINTAGTSGAPSHNRFYFNSGGSHTIVFGATGSTARLSGVQVYNGDADKGVRLIDAAHSGWKTGDYTDSKYLDLWAAAEPDLVTIMLGINDRGASVTAATVKTNIQGFISGIRSRMPNNPPSIAVCVTWPQEGDMSVWDPYAAALRSIADEDATIAIIDWYRWMGMAYAGAGSYWLTDVLHPSPAGHTWMGATAASFLTAGTTPADVGGRTATDLTHVGSSTWVAPASATTISPTYPTGMQDATTTQTDMVFAFIHNKPDTASVATPTGWEFAWSATGGSGSQGFDTGATRVDVFRRVGTAALSGTTQAFAITGGSSPLAFMRAYRATGTSVHFEEEFTSWSVTTASTSVGGTAAANLWLAAKDEIAAVIGTPSDLATTLTLTSVTASGATTGTITAAPTGTTTQGQGNDSSAAAWRVPITAGETIVPPVVAATSNSSRTALGALFRVRATIVTVYNKTGGVAGPVAGSGAKTVTTGSGTTYTKTGGAAPAGAASGPKTITSATVYTKTGGAAPAAAGSGAKSVVYAKTGAAAGATAASGAELLASPTDITTLGTSAWASGTTSVAPTHVTNQQDDLLALVVHNKPDTATPTTPTGWAQIFTGTGGAGTQGSGTGLTRVTIFARRAPDGGLSGTETVTITGGNVAQAHLRAWRATGSNLAYSVGASNWSIGTASTTLSGSVSSPLSSKAELAVIVGTRDDEAATLAVTDISAPAVTFGALTQDPTGTSAIATGNQISATAYRVPVVTATSATVTVSVTATSNSSETAIGVVLRVAATATAALAKTGGGGTPLAASGAKTVTSATTTSKTAAAASAAAAAGAKSVVHDKTGSTAGAAAASGPKTVSAAAVTTKTGGAASASAASGAKTVTSATTTSKTGGGASSAAASGSKTVISAAIVTKTGGTAASAAASGPKTVSSATAVNKTGGTAASTAASGAKSVIRVKTGAAATAGAAAGPKAITSGTVYSKTGGAAAATAASGPKALDTATTSNKTGGAASTTAASGAKSVVHAKTGGAAGAGAAAGAKTVTPATTFTKTGGAAGPLATGGAKVVSTAATTSKTGGTASATAATGNRTTVHGKTGAAGAPTAGSGTKTVSSATTVNKTGAGAASAAASGAKTVTSATTTTKTGGSAGAAAATGGKALGSTNATTKAGAAAASGATSGAKSVVHAKTGGATGSGAASGAKTSTPYKTGGAAGAAAASGGKTLVHGKTGGAATATAANGGKTISTAGAINKTGGTAAPAAASGPKTVTSATTVNKTGGSAAPAAATGAKTVSGSTEFVKTGGGAPAAAASGAKTVQSVGAINKTGGATGSTAASGAKTVTTTVYVKTGGAAGTTAASGARTSSAAVVHVKTGAAAPVSLAGGGKALIRQVDKAGGATPALAVSGAKTVTTATAYATTGGAAASTACGGTVVIANNIVTATDVHAGTPTELGGIRAGTPTATTGAGIHAGTPIPV